MFINCLSLSVCMLFVALSLHVAAAIWIIRCDNYISLTALTACFCSAVPEWRNLLSRWRQLHVCLLILLRRKTLWILQRQALLIEKIGRIFENMKPTAMCYYFLSVLRRILLREMQRNLLPRLLQQGLFASKSALAEVVDATTGTCLAVHMPVQRQLQLLLWQKVKPLRHPVQLMRNQNASTSLCVSNAQVWKSTFWCGI